MGERESAPLLVQTYQQGVIRVKLRQLFWIMPAVLEALVTRNSRREEPDKMYRKKSMTLTLSEMENFQISKEVWI